MDIADDVEGLDDAKWNLQVVQKRPSAGGERKRTEDDWGVVSDKREGGLQSRDSRCN